MIDWNFLSGRLDCLCTCANNKINNMGIKHGVSCINVCLGLRKLLKPEAARPSVKSASERLGKRLCTEISMCD